MGSITIPVPFVLASPTLSDAEMRIAAGGFMQHGIRHLAAAGRFADIPEEGLAVTVLDPTGKPVTATVPAIPAPGGPADVEWDEGTIGGITDPGVLVAYLKLAVQRYLEDIIRAGMTEQTSRASQKALDDARSGIDVGFQSAAP